MSRSDEEILYIILEEVDLRLDFRIGWPKKALAGPSALPHIFILYINPCNVTIPNSLQFFYSHNLSYRNIYPRDLAT